MKGDLYAYSGQSVRSAFKWRFKLALLFFFFGFAVLKNSGCTAFLGGSGGDINTNGASIYSQKAPDPLSINPGAIELYPQSNYSAVFQVRGGVEPYSFFLKGSEAFTLDIFSTNSAKLKLKTSAHLSEIGTPSVYVMDGGGNMAFAGVRVREAPVESEDS